MEVKFSKLTVAVSKRKTKTYRWNWAKVFGDKGNKVFDRLILVGEVHKECAYYYKDKNSPYIFFDIPYSEIMDFATKSNNYFKSGKIC